MYLLSAALVSPTKKLTEEELFQRDDLKGAGRRLAIALAAFALLILSLSAAYDNGGQPQTIAAGRPATMAAKE